MGSVIFKKDAEYNRFVAAIKNKIRAVQAKAAVSVNVQLIALYWYLGQEITTKVSRKKWGTKVIETLSKDLSNEFPEMKGFSRSNLYSIYQWYNFYKDQSEFVQQLVGQIPWGHNLIIVTKVKDVSEALWYTKQAIENSWSRSILMHQIDLNLHKRLGRTKITNFASTLPRPQSELVTQTLKDPYIFDFFSIGKEANERAIEMELTKHIQKFLLELGRGFAFVGNQYHLEVDGEDFYLDMLFYHLKLRCYVVIELKADKFKPAHAGQLNFYLSAVDATLKAEHDNPTVGIILCKDKGGKITGEYALKNINSPIGLSEYKIVESIPKNLKGSLPSIKELEKELSSKNISKN